MKLRLIASGKSYYYDKINQAIMRLHEAKDNGETFDLYLDIGGRMLVMFASYETSYTKTKVQGSLGMFVNPNAAILS